MKQATNTILMVRPINFKMNAQTKVNNYYQKSDEGKNAKVIQDSALREFNDFVTKLEQHHIQVIVVDDTQEYDTPDSIFPNNWISFHQDGTVGIYPMFAENRRLERREDILDLIENHGFLIHQIIDYTSAEKEGVYLEGTGSIVLDRVNKKAYCALSPRADEDLFIEFCEDFEYTPVIFTSYQTIDSKRKEIYHTNVMMGITDSLAIVCLESIDDKKERKNLINHLKQTGKEIISITQNQVVNFLGNVLQVNGVMGKKYLVMSLSAENSLTSNQKKKIEQYYKIISSPLNTIETYGGGSARCMMAEVFLPKI